MAQFCARSAELNAGSAAGRPAAMGRAFHALCADPASAATAELLALLTPEELATIRSWDPPADLSLPELGVTLLYRDAAKEQPLGLTRDGTPCAYESPDALITGTLDMAWVVDTGLEKWAIVGDIKSRRTTSVPDSLQLHAYAYAYAHQHGCECYLTAIWAAADGVWLLADPVHLETQGPAVWARLKAAATNEGVTTGPHCQDCYQRIRCVDYMLPAVATTSTPPPYLPLIQADPAAMSNLEALEALRLLRKRRELDEAAENLLKAWADANGGITDEDGKRWSGSMQAGRSSLDTSALAKDYPELAQQYTRNGTPFKTYRWTK